MDTAAMCGGTLDDLHLWMLDIVDIHTHWIELRALANRGQHSTCEQIDDPSQQKPETREAELPMRYGMFRPNSGNNAFGSMRI